MIHSPHKLISKSFTIHRFMRLFSFFVGGFRWPLLLSVNVYWSVCFTTHSRHTRLIQNIKCTSIKLYSLTLSRVHALYLSLALGMPTIPWSPITRLSAFLSQIRFGTNTGIRTDALAIHRKRRLRSDRAANSAIVLESYDAIVKTTFFLVKIHFSFKNTHSYQNILSRVSFIENIKIS